MKKIILTKRKKPLLDAFLTFIAAISGSVIAIIILKGKDIPYLIMSVIFGLIIGIIYVFLRFVLFRRLY